jgi:hypothetical protein
MMNPPVSSQDSPATPAFFGDTEEGVSDLVPWYCAVTMLAGALLAWDGRYAMDPDGMSYIDMATSTVAQGWHHLLNGYWSPLYAAMLAIVFSFHPSPGREIPAIQFLNWIIFDIATLSFAFFFRQWRSTIRDSVSESFLVPFAFSTFLLGTAQFINVTTVGPDLCMAALVFLSAGICCQVGGSQASWKHFAGLGLVLGAGCYVKTPMFPVALILLAILFLASPSGERIKLLAVSAAVLLIVSSPLIVAQSALAGHPSIGQSGQLNYVWQLDGLHPQYTVADPSLASYVGRARILTRTPATLEFASPSAGSYPLWFDPAYWYGQTLTRFHFSLRRQLELFRTNLKVYGGAVYYMSGLFGGAFALLLTRSRKHSAADRVNITFVGWASLVFLMYALVHVDYRYIGAFFIVFWLGCYGLLVQRNGPALSRGVLITVACSTLIATSALAFRDRSSRESLDQVVVAQTLREMGIQPGDLVANVGYTYNAYYAQMAQIHIAAQVVDAKRFWSLDPGQVSDFRENLTRLGIKAIIARDPPVEAAQSGCRIVSGTRFHRFCIVPL